MDESWTEDDSALYRRLADVAVPDRESQIATMVTLLPLAPDEPARVVELGCGTGALSCAILETFPACRVTALDGSDSMLERARAHLAPYGERAHAKRFDLAGSAWYHHLDGADAVVSSLVIHHLSGEEKRALFVAVARSLAPGGGFFIADLVLPQRAEPRELFASTWDRSAEERARRRGEPSLYRAFQQEKWNVFRHPDPVDQPSPLFDQLRWLADAGLEAIDCFLMSSGHAVYGGYRGTGRRRTPVGYSDAFASACRALSKTSR